MKRLRLTCGILLCSVALLYFTNPGIAQMPLQTLLVGVDRRPVQSLNGPWHYLVEQPPARELYKSNGTVRDDGYAMNTHPNLDDAQPHNGEYDFATAPTLNVPGDWNTQDSALLRFEGVVWYQRNFRFTPKDGTRTFFHVGAANYKSFVWINGKRLCSHEGGFTPYDCDATALLRSGDNFVVIAVDSTRHREDLPSLSYDFFDYGGITRDVSLVTVPKDFIDDYEVQLKHDATFDPRAPSARTLTGYVHLEGASPGSRVTVKIPELHWEAIATTDRDGKATFEVEAKSMELWSPAQPKIYTVVVAAGGDSITDRIGFRDIRVEGTKILLNGKPIILLGANVHAEAPIRGGRAYSDEDVESLYAMLRAIHANFARLCHYPHDERMTRKADSSGMLVWSEIPIWQSVAFGNPETYRKAVIMLHEMIRRDHNKASVIFWSLSNETPNTAERTVFLRNLAEEARRTDPTRLITSALIDPAKRSDTIEQNDPLMQWLDVVGQNEYIGWYEGRPADADRKKWVLPQKPFIMSEFGAEATQGNHGDPESRWTEEQQVNVLQHQFEMIRRIPQMRGVTPWVLMDFRSPVRNIPKLQDGYNRKGLFSDKGKAKRSVELVRKVYMENPPVRPE